VARAPPKPSPNWTKGLGHAPPLPSFSTSLLSPLLLVGLGKKESYSRWDKDSPLGAPSSLVGRLPLAPLYTGAGGTLEHTS